MGWLHREVERAHTRHAEEAAEEEARQRAIAEFQSASRKVKAALSSFGDYVLPSWEEEHHGLTVPPIVKMVGLTADAAPAVYLASLNGDADALGKLLAVYLEPPPAAEEGGGEEAAEAAEPPTWLLVDRYGWEPVAHAAAGGHLDALQVLLKAGSDAASRNPYSGRSALHRAVEAGHAALIEPLVTAGASINAPAKDHTTPLHLAAMHGNVEVAKALLEAGAKVDPKDVCESTPLLVAAEAGHSEVVEALLEAGAALDAADENGYTPLHHACDAEHVALAVALVGRGADAERKTRGGKTCSMVRPALFADGSELAAALQARADAKAAAEAEAAAAAAEEQ